MIPSYSISASPRRRWSYPTLCLLTACILVAGCRSYGGGGAEEEIYEQIESATEMLQQELARIRSDGRLLEEAAASDTALAPYAEEFRGSLEAHAAAAERHAEYLESISPNSTYRNLKRTLGAVMSEHQAIRTRYDRLLGLMEEGRLMERAADRLRFVPPRPYSIASHYYRRIAEGGTELTMSEVLRRYASGGREQMPRSTETQQGAGGAFDRASDGEPDAPGEAPSSSDAPAEGAGSTASDGASAGAGGE